MEKVSRTMMTTVSGLDRNEVHNRLLEGRRLGKYWSITTMPEPWLPWAPLPMYSEKETRPCHCSKSRIHQLQCGHVVAVSGDAETCAQNCAGMDMETTIVARTTQRPSPDTHDNMDQPCKNPQDISNSGMAGLIAYTLTFLYAANVPDAMERSTALKGTFDKMCFVHQWKNRPDLLGGDFECKECGDKGHRPTVPTHTYRRDPWHIIIPIRDERDEGLVRELKRGVIPQAQQYRNRRRRGFGPRRHFARREVTHGRIERQRREEKTRVINQLREDNIVAEIEEMDLFG